MAKKCWEMRNCSEELKSKCAAYQRGMMCFEACLECRCPCGRQAMNCKPTEYTRRYDLKEIEVIKSGCLTCQFFHDYLKERSSKD